MSALPDFLYIGAPRTGSTWLYGVLRAHPELYLAPSVKESHFFSGAADATAPDLPRVHMSYRLTDDLAAYAQLFTGAPAGLRCGEIDPSILSCAPYAIPKIKQVLGDCQYLIVLRQPAERAYSHYLLHVRYGGERHSFEYYLDLKNPRDAYERIALHRYFQMSFYYTNLKLFLDAFGPTAVRVLLYDDLQASPTAYLQTILNFLHLSPLALPQTNIETNAGAAPRGILGSLRRPRHPLRHFARQHLPLPLRRRVKSLLAQHSSTTNGWHKPPLAPATRHTLTRRYRQDILQVQDLIHRDLSHWLDDKSLRSNCFDASSSTC